MQRKKEDRKRPIGDEMRVYDNMTMHVVSGTECTGMTPTPPTDEEEADAYGDLSGIWVEDSKKTGADFPHSQRH